MHRFQNTVIKEVFVGEKKGWLQRKLDIRLGKQTWERCAEVFKRRGLPGPRKGARAWRRTSSSRGSRRTCRSRRGGRQGSGAPSRR